MQFQTAEVTIRSNEPFNREALPEKSAKWIAVTQKLALIKRAFRVVEGIVLFAAALVVLAYITPVRPLLDKLAAAMGTRPESLLEGVVGFTIALVVAELTLIRLSSDSIAKQLKNLTETVAGAPDVQVFRTQTVANEHQINAVIDERLHSAEFLEYSAKNASDLLKHAATVAKNCHFQVLFCHPDDSVSKKQRRSIINTIDELEGGDIFRVHEEVLASIRSGKPVNRSTHLMQNAEVRLYHSLPSIRARRFGHDLIAVGWYTSWPIDSEEDLKRVPWIKGHDNPMIVARLDTDAGRWLNGMFQTAFESLWKDAVPFEVYLSERTKTGGRS